MNLVFTEQISESSMSSDLFLFDGSFFPDPFSPFSESSIDILQAFPETCYNLTAPLEKNDHFASTTTTTTLLSNSPPSHQLEALSLNYQNTHMGILDLPALEVKTEEFQIPFYPSPHNDYSSSSNSSSFHLSHSYGGTGSGTPANVALKMMQRSYSSNSFEGKLISGKSFIFQPKFDSLVESPNLHSQLLTSPDHCFSSASSQIRRACSTGDLQNVKTSHANQRLSSSPLATESSFMEEANFKVGRYSAEERKDRILRYRAKRTQRNFNKTIKYACRKTLADNRPRIRGRFAARTDEPGEAPKTTTFNRYEDDDDLWIDGFHEDDEQGMVGRGQLFGSYDPTLFQQYGYS